MVEGGRQWPVGGGFGGRDGSRRKEAGQQVVASVGTAETDERSLVGRSWLRWERRRLRQSSSVGISMADLVFSSTAVHVYLFV